MAKIIQSLIHEITPEGQHRIVKFRNGIPSASTWYEHHEIAIFGQLRASVHSTSALPAGIFKVTEVAGEQLL